MKWLTFDMIVRQLRLDDMQAELERPVLELYGSAAEDAVLNAIRRSYDGVVAKYGEVPAALVLSSLLLVDLSYQHRSPVGQTGMNVVPYGFDLMLKPYIRLSGEEDDGGGEGALPAGALLESGGAALTTSDGLVLCVA